MVVVTVLAHRDVGIHAAEEHPVFAKAIERLDADERIEGARPELEVAVLRHCNSERCRLIMVEIGSSRDFVKTPGGKAQAKNACDLNRPVMGEEILDSKSQIAESVKGLVPVMLIIVVDSKRQNFVRDIQ